MADGTDFAITKDAVGNIKIVTVEKVSTYDPWISVKKLLIQAATVGGVASLTYLVDIGLPQLSIDLPEYAGIITIISGIIAWALNYSKHKTDTKLVTKEITPTEIK